MQTSDFALVRGLADTRATLDRWNERPAPVIKRWLAGASAITAALLLAAWLIAMLSVPDPRATFLGLDDRPHIGDVMHVLGRNSLVLALHAMACVAGFIAGSSLPLEAQRRSGAPGWIHEKAGPLAIGFVIAATTFSLVTLASRQENWHELLAATIVTVLLAIPVLVAAAFVEVYVSPGLLRSLAG